MLIFSRLLLQLNIIFLIFIPTKICNYNLLVSTDAFYIVWLYWYVFISPAVSYAYIVAVCWK